MDVYPLVVTPRPGILKNQATNGFNRNSVILFGDGCFVCSIRVVHQYTLGAMHVGLLYCL